MATSTKEKREVTIQRLKEHRMTIYFYGNDLVMNRPTKKMWEQLLLPPIRSNRAGRAAVLKHDPVAEFRDSVYMCRDESAPTLFHLPGGAFKGAGKQAALDTPGATKAEIGRLVQVVTPTIHIYGIPRLFMTIVKQAGISKTPDVRTRARFSEFCCAVEFKFYQPITDVDVLNLYANSGMVTGVGDGRAEKGGALQCGSFEPVDPSDQRYQLLVKHGGRAKQLEAIQNPVAFDDTSEEMLAWYESEIVRRGRDSERKTTIPVLEDSGVPMAVAAKSTRKRKAGNGRGARL
jgi:hypothetical protein